MALILALRPALFGLYFLSGLVPRRPARWVFGSWSGWRFEDNAGVLFEYVNTHSPGDIEAIWISRDPAIVRSLRQRGYRACLTWSPGGIWYGLTAGVFVFDGLTKDINHWVSRGAFRALLRHGTGLKKIERAIEYRNHRLYKLFHGNLLEQGLWTLAIPWHRVIPDFSTSTSPRQSQQAVDCFGIAPDKVVITGLPRNDCLFQPPPDNPDDIEAQWISRQHAGGKKVFLYMPTFRDTAGHFSIPWAMLDRLCDRLNCRLLMKPHFVHREMITAEYPQDSDNFFLSDSRLLLNRLFPLVDGLISDYSSVTYDFILTGKPVIFFVPDLAEYFSHSRTLFYTFDEVTPGPKVRNESELEIALRSAIAGDTAEWEDLYASTLRLFHTYRDGDSSKRTYSELRRYCGLPAVATEPSPPCSSTSRIAVVIPVYNQQADLLRTLASVDCQSADLEFFVVDDGSTPAVQVDEHDFSHPVHLIRLPGNSGCTVARNTALKRVLDGGFHYVALQDAGDTDIGERMARQAAYLDAHADIAVVGAWAQYVDRAGRPLYIYRAPLSSDAIRARMPFVSAFAHPASMIRIDALRTVGLYDTAFPIASDYEIFFRLTGRYATANLPEILINKEDNPNSLSLGKRKRSLMYRLRAQIMHFRPLSANAWLGAAWTLVLLLLPYRLVVVVKRWRGYAQ